jgi:hypothetical protein
MLGGEALVLNATDVTKLFIQPQTKLENLFGVLCPCLGMLTGEL